jgi:peptidoglycan hydrolase CwlO-like protein
MPRLWWTGAYGQVYWDDQGPQLGQDSPQQQGTNPQAWAPQQQVNPQQQANPQQEIEFLENQEKAIQEQIKTMTEDLKQIKKEITKLKKEV